MLNHYPTIMFSSLYPDFPVVLSNNALNIVFRHPEGKGWPNYTLHRSFMSKLLSGATALRSLLSWIFLDRSWVECERWVANRDNGRESHGMSTFLGDSCIMYWLGLYYSDAFMLSYNDTIHYAILVISCRSFVQSNEDIFPAKILAKGC